MDIALLIEEYLKNFKEFRDYENDSLNIVDNNILEWNFNSNIPCPTMEELEALQPQVEVAINQAEVNAQALKFLAESDFKVLRHIRQKALGQELSLSDEDYLALEQERADAAARIVK